MAVKRYRYVVKCGSVIVGRFYNLRKMEEYLVEVRRQRNAGPNKKRGTMQNITWEKQEVRD